MANTPLLFQLHVVFIASFVVLVVLPPALLAEFLWRGRAARLQDLLSLGTARRKASELLRSEDCSNRTFGDVLEAQFSQSRQTAKFALPFALFWLPYSIGVYWSMIALAGESGFVPAELTDAPGALPEPARLVLLALLGTALACNWHMVWRVIRRDVSPNMFLHLAGRLVVTPGLASVVAFGTDLATSSAAVPLVAFLAGFCPVVSIYLAVQRFADIAGIERTAIRRPLNRIEGLGREDVLRLWEEGVNDAENLAMKSTVSLLTDTRYSLEEIIDWKDQCLLYVYVGDELDAWRAHYVRGAMDVLGSDGRYYGPQAAQALTAAMSESLGKPAAVLDRFVNTIVNDPRVHQLWEYLVQSHPTTVAESILAVQQAPQPVPGLAAALAPSPERIGEAS